MNKAFLFDNISLSVGGKSIFSGISMAAERGEILAVCGPGSSHMPYLANLLSRCYDAPYSLTGQLFIDGADVERLNEEEMRFFRMMNVAVLPSVKPDTSLRMSVQKYILLPFREGVKKTSHDIMTDAKRIMELLGTGNPERILRKKMSALSTKDLRAVMYAAALATDPAVAVFFADAEDMTAQEVEDLYMLLIKVAKIKNIALLFLTADLPLARRYGEKVYVAKQDKLFLLDGTANPYVQFLEEAAEMKPLTLPPAGEKELLTAASVVPARKMKRMYFTLHSGEILVLPQRNGLSVFSGKHRPVSGRLTVGRVSIRKSKAFRKGVFPISASMLFPPAHTIDAVLRAFALRPSTRLSTAQIYMNLGLLPDYGKMAVPQGSVYETLRLGLICAAAAEAPLLLVSDIDQIPSATDRYEILTLLSAVCQQTGAGALVFSDREGVQRAVGTLLDPKARLSASLEEAVPLA